MISGEIRDRYYDANRSKRASPPCSSCGTPTARSRGTALDDSACLGGTRPFPEEEDPTALHAVYPLMEKSKHECCAGTFFVGVLSVDMWSAGLAPGSSSLRSSLRAWPWGLYGFTLYEVPPCVCCVSPRGWGATQALLHKSGKRWRGKGGGGYVLYADATV